MWLGEEKGNLQDWVTQQWVKLTGKKVTDNRFAWLRGPAGHTDQIGEKFVDALTKAENLTLHRNLPGSGLMPSVAAFGFTEEEEQRVNSRITDFYTRTVDYDFEVWSVWSPAFRWIGHLLSGLFSKRLRQLNLPLNPIEASRGISSHILQLKDMAGTVRYTIWYRILRSTGRVVYSGIYSTIPLPDGGARHVKVVFPLPNGNATVIMQRQVLPDGSLKLVSAGKKAGDSGFYFTITDKQGRFWIKFVRPVRETIHVFEEAGELRTDHELHFYGLPVFKLHYKIFERQRTPVAGEAGHLPY